jgi:hypothetical protein
MADDLIDFDCPRCHQPASSPFYGPCPTCRDDLRATVGRAPQAVEVADYEPKMNVTPNAVATKD